MKKTNEELEKLLAVFRKETLENFFTLSTYLRTTKVSVEELGNYLAWKRRKIKETRKLSEEENIKRRKKTEEVFAKWQEKTKKCPKCNSSLLLSRVNAPKGRGNKEGWRSLWSCPNEKCLFEEYSKEFTDKIYTEIMEG